MPALPERITFIQNEYRRAIVDDSAVRLRHGERARESDDPIPTFFDNVADAQIMANRRQTLLSPERRRFRVRVVGLEEAQAIEYTGGLIPTAHYRDIDRNCERTCIIASIVINLEQQQAEIGVWG